LSMGLISHFFDPLWFPEWRPRTNRVTYRLNRPPSQEYITPIERIPVSALRQHPKLRCDGP